MGYDLSISGLKYLEHWQQLAAFKLIINVDPCNLIPEACQNENFECG